jgi:hypothetical protein
MIESLRPAAMRSKPVRLERIFEDPMRSSMSEGPSLRLEGAVRVRSGLVLHDRDWPNLLSEVYRPASLGESA